MDLPGTTGGVAPSAQPPDRLRFMPCEDAAQLGLLLNGDPVEVTMGLGMARVEQGDDDLWLFPIVADTLVMPEVQPGRWDYPEVYRRE
jgi:hypothetical protein